MKIVRVGLIIGLVAGTLALPGCATTDSARREAEQSDWNEMTTAQKVGVYLWWPVQFGLLWGFGAAANSTSH